MIIVSSQQSFLDHGSTHCISGLSGLLWHTGRTSLLRWGRSLREFVVDDVGNGVFCHVGVCHFWLVGGIGVVRLSEFYMIQFSPPWI